MLTCGFVLQARLEIMGKKAKNAISISGTNADQIAKEITKVEKRRVVKSTLCNERSSRSHCLVIHFVLDCDDNAPLYKNHDFVLQLSIIYSSL